MLTKLPRMKRLLLLIFLINGTLGSFFNKACAQQEAARQKGFAWNKKYNLDLSFGGDKQDTVKRTSAPKGRFMGGLTFTRLDIGFSRLIDNGSFSLSPKNSFLDYKDAKTSTVSFDLVYFGYRFNPNFKVYVAGGFDWTLIRLKNNITIQKNMPELTYVEAPVDFSKNRFSSSYVHFPLNFELRTKENERGKRFYLIFGPEVSFLINGKIKQISDERGKEKFRDDYNFQKFRVGGSARIGYGWIGLFTKYYFTDMFDSAPQEGLKNMAFGISFGLN